MFYVRSQFVRKFKSTLPALERDPYVLSLAQVLHYLPTLHIYPLHKFFIIYPLLIIYPLHTFFMATFS